MTKQLTSAEAAALIYGKPGTKVIDGYGRNICVDKRGFLRRDELCESSALSHQYAPFTIPADPAELPEDVRRELPRPGSGFVERAEVSRALEALWRHIKPEAKR